MHDLPDPSWRVIGDGLLTGCHARIRFELEATGRLVEHVELFTQGDR